MNIDSGQILYHGSYIEVPSPDIRFCRDGKDFGRGFYLTSSKSQAEKFTRTAVIKALHDGRISDSAAGVVSVFKAVFPEELKIFQFSDADPDWLHCVVAHRRTGIFPEVFAEFSGYDIIIGKIANDTTNLVITTYMDGLYGDIPSERADEIAIGFLEPERLKDQFCFRTEKAIQCLQFIESYQVIL